MDLEQRVQALEQEVEILKNQIQTTLLDIREKLLNDTYPALKAEDSVPTPNGRGEATPTGSSMPGSKAPDMTMQEDVFTSPHVRRVSFNDAEMHQPNGNSEQSGGDHRPKVEMPEPAGNGKPSPHLTDVHQASTHQFKETPPDDHLPAETPPMLPAVPNQEITPAPVTEVDLVSLELLENWVKRRVESNGPRHTRALIETYAEEGLFNAKIRDILLRLVSVIVEDQFPTGQRSTSPYFYPSEVLHSAKSHTTHVHQVQPQVAEEDGAYRNLILKLIAGVKNVGVTAGRR